VGQLLKMIKRGLICIGIWDRLGIDVGENGEEDSKIKEDGINQKPPSGGRQKMEVVQSFSRQQRVCWRE